MSKRIVRHLEAVPVTAGGPHFFGYYDKCPWRADGRALLAARAEFQDRPPTETDVLTLGVVNLDADNAFEPFAETTAWSWQQGTMLQWAGDRNRVVYNSRREDGQVVGKVHDLDTGEVREVPRPIYALHTNGREAISLDFHRLQTLRPGYGYPPKTDITEHNAAPDDVGLWQVNLETGQERLACSIGRARLHHEDPRGRGAHHWVNHATYNTDGSRFCFLHRFRCAEGRAGPWITRLFTCEPDGAELYLLNGHGVVSHFAWRDPNHLLAWSDGPAGEPPAYHLLQDKTQSGQVLAEGLLDRDGHMTYSPDGRWILTDTYPGKADGKQSLFLLNVKSGQLVEVGRFEAPLKGPLRCDLHPRFSRDGKQVCFDSAHTGTRQVWVMDVSSITGK